ncbi:hypothetical protein BpHYR1_002506 [Brachionus plicatilis]|uniref:Uncharacterized protein n=1 Tax=Brachionus plicatilis TaxID=10195 RepID=A0A3M7Q599_BRAPC|nr:hypothetical protein BpHYR1_002506 [Brachionus plicatilis]
MPYCLIWSSFTLINLGITRETNGKNVLPHKYAFDTYKSVIGNCKEFLSKEKKKSLILNKKKNSRESDFQNVSNFEEAWKKVEIESITDLNLIEAYISCNKKSNKTLIIPNSIGQKIILSGQYHSKNKRIFLNKVDFNRLYLLSRNTDFLINWGHFCSYIKDIKDIDWHFCPRLLALIQYYKNRYNFCAKIGVINRSKTVEQESLAQIYFILNS